MPHLDNRILAPQVFEAEGVKFPVYIRPMAGKPIVCMVPREETMGNEMKFDLPKEVSEKYQPDFGVVAAFRPRQDSEGNIIYAHDRELVERMKKGAVLVAVKPYTGNWYTSKDFDWIPEGRIMKILGTVEDWNENILTEVAA